MPRSSCSCLSARVARVSMTIGEVCSGVAIAACYIVRLLMGIRDLNCCFNNKFLIRLLVSNLSKKYNIGWDEMFVYYGKE